MKIGKTITTVTSPQRSVRKANETRKDPRIQPIPVEMPKRKVKKKQEVEAMDDFQFSYQMAWGVKVSGQSPIINTSVF